MPAIDPQPRRGRRIFGLAAALALIILVGTGLVRHAANADFVCYWTSAHLLAQGHNPYDRAAVGAIESSLGYRGHLPFVMRNPPWALPFVAGLGYAGLRTGALLWSAVLLLLIAIAVVLLTRDVPQRRIRAFLFAPLISCLMLGQLTAILVFASACFLVFRDRRPFVAGLALSLAVLKPHLLFLFWPVLLVDCWRRRDLRLPAGLLVGVASLTALSLALDPHAWLQYRAAMEAEAIGGQILPNLSSGFRSLLFPRWGWVQLLPSLIGAAVALGYYLRRPWDWLRDGALLIAVSAILSPYSWMYDLALILPAALRAPGGRRAERLFLFCSLLTFVPLVLTGLWNSPWTALTGLWWGAWLLYVERSRGAAMLPGAVDGPAQGELQLAGSGGAPHR
ncbi:MAG TPA: glycosyltransferase 87 family protein [Acidobacteriaceae bacterium]|jgi:hypothetical protein|nr:glycosyltransferase 87 family protein [Acidobacteriaceae bacterium]